MGLKYAIEDGTVNARGGRPKGENPFTDAIAALANDLSGDQKRARVELTPTGEDVPLRTLKDGTEVVVDRAEKIARQQIEAASRELNVTAYKEFVEGEDGSLTVLIAVTERRASTGGRPRKVQDEAGVTRVSDASSGLSNTPVTEAV